MTFGLVLGFGATYATIEAIDRLGREPVGDASAPAVLGDPDYERYCARDGDLVGLNSTGDAFGWRCVGAVNGLWSTDEIDVGELCRWQFGADASEYLADAASPDGWRCVAE